jgi:hypothetical protein
MGIDVWEVIAAAKTKPFGYHALLSLAPAWAAIASPLTRFYLTWKAREYGEHTRFIELAGEINTAMPQPTSSSRPFPKPSTTRKTGRQRLQNPCSSAWPIRPTWMTTANLPAMF